jgi:hypothetical protein
MQLRAFTPIDEGTGGSGKGTELDYGTTVGFSTPQQSQTVATPATNTNKTKTPEEVKDLNQSDFVDYDDTGQNYENVINDEIEQGYGDLGTAIATTHSQFQSLADENGEYGFDDIQNMLNETDANGNFVVDADGSAGYRGKFENILKKDVANNYHENLADEAGLNRLSDEEKQFILKDGEEVIADNLIGKDYDGNYHSLEEWSVNNSLGEYYRAMKEKLKDSIGSDLTDEEYATLTKKLAEYTYKHYSSDAVMTPDMYWGDFRDLDYLNIAEGTANFILSLDERAGKFESSAVMEKFRDLDEYASLSSDQKEALEDFIKDSEDSDWLRGIKGKEQEYFSMHNIKALALKNGAAKKSYREGKADYYNKNRKATLTGIKSHELPIVGVNPNTYEFEVEKVKVGNKYVRKGQQVIKNLADQMNDNRGDFKDIVLQGAVDLEGNPQENIRLGDYLKVVQEWSAKKWKHNIKDIDFGITYAPVSTVLPDGQAALQIGMDITDGDGHLHSVSAQVSLDPATGIGPDNLGLEPAQVNRMKDYGKLAYWMMANNIDDNRGVSATTLPQAWRNGLQGASRIKLENGKVRAGIADPIASKKQGKSVMHWFTPSETQNLFYGGYDYKDYLYNKKYKSKK